MPSVQTFAHSRIAWCCKGSSNLGSQAPTTHLTMPIITLSLLTFYSLFAMQTSHRQRRLIRSFPISWQIIGSRCWLVRQHQDWFLAAKSTTLPASSALASSACQSMQWFRYGSIYVQIVRNSPHTASTKCRCLCLIDKRSNLNRSLHSFLICATGKHQTVKSNVPTWD